MKKIILVFLFLIFVFSSCSNNSSSNGGNTVSDIQKKGKIVMYTEAGFPPFEYFKGDTLVGVDIDIANEIAKDLGVKLEVKNVKFDALISSIKTGKSDFVAAGLGKTQERLREVDFSIEYSSSRQSIISKKDNPMNNVESLKGKKVGIQTGTTSDIILQDIINQGILAGSNTEIKRYNSPLDATQDLLVGRIDAVIVDEIVGSTIIQKETLLSQAIMKDDNGEDIVEKTSIAIQKGNVTLIDAINKTLERWAW